MFKNLILKKFNFYFKTKNVTERKNETDSKNIELLL